MPNGEAQIISKHLNNDNVLIDLAADFRLQKASDYFKWYKQKHKAVNNIKHSIYSLPEITGKKVKDHKIMVEGLKRGDEVITSGGIIGTVERVMEDDRIEVLIGENTKVEIIRSTITSLLKKEEVKK